jgi:hypothetical protein
MRPQPGWKRTIVSEIGCDLQSAENMIGLTKPVLGVEAPHLCGECTVQHITGVETCVNMIGIGHLPVK